MFLYHGGAHVFYSSKWVDYAKHKKDMSDNVQRFSKYTGRHDYKLNGG